MAHSLGGSQPKTGLAPVVLQSGEAEEWHGGKCVREWGMESQEAERATGSDSGFYNCLQELPLRKVGSVNPRHLCLTMYMSLVAISYSNHS